MCIINIKLCMICSSFRDIPYPLISRYNSNRLSNSTQGLRLLEFWCQLFKTSSNSDSSLLLGWCPPWEPTKIPRFQWRQFLLWWVINCNFCFFKTLCKFAFCSQTFLLIFHPRASQNSRIWQILVRRKWQYVRLSLKHFLSHWVLTDCSKQTLTPISVSLDS